MNIFKKLKKFDAHPKPLEDYSVKTLEGAAISVLTYLAIIVLIFSETLDFLSENTSEQLFVDTTRSPEMKINLGITIPRISCDYISLDAVDSSGEQHFQIKRQVLKVRIDENGNAIGDPQKEEDVKMIEKSTQETNVTCGSCYGAELTEGQCCNTCEDVQEAYKTRRWKIPDLKTIEQCKNSEVVKKMESVLKEGCQIDAVLVVNRVSGSFHLAPGKSFSINHIHVHDVQPFASKDFNTSHFIKHLSFGENTHQKHVDPLDGTESIATEGGTMYYYYIKIVPTIYETLNRKVIHTNQFSVTKHSKSLSFGDSGMPGIFFQYELSPLVVKRTEKKRPLGHFITNICVIVGGVYTVAGIINSILYRSIKLIKEKQQIGKFS